MSHRFSLVSLISICLFCVFSHAQTTTQPAATQAASAPTTQDAAEEECATCGVMERDRLLNNWLGYCDGLTEKGVDITLDLTQVYQQNLRGGLSTHDNKGIYSGRYDFDVTFDLDKLFKLPGASIYVSTSGGWSDGINDTSVGSLFGVNYVPVGDTPVEIWQLYYEQKFLEDKAFVRVGTVYLPGSFECRECPGSFDGNSFADDETSQFLNYSLVNNPTIPFPDPGLGILAHLTPVEWWYVSAAVVDAQAELGETGFKTTFHGPSDFFSMYETGVMPELTSGKGALQGAYRVGMWYDPQPKERFDGEGMKTDDLGFYTSCDQMVWKENTTDDDSQGLGVFGRYGIADAQVNDVKSFWSTGMQYQGLIPGRDNDVMGVGVGHGRLSQQAGYTTSNETDLEWYYNIQITPWMSISPDVQYVMNPGGDETLRNAVVIGVRAFISF